MSPKLIFLLLLALPFSYAIMEDRKPSLESVRRLKALKEVMKNHEEHLAWRTDAPLDPNDVFCFCNEPGCDKDITDIDRGYKGICRVPPGGACRVTMSKNSKNQTSSYTKSCVLKEHLNPAERPFECESTLTSSIYCCRESLCNDEEITIPTETAEASESRWHLFLLLLFFVAVFFSGVGLIVGVFCLKNEKWKRFWNGIIARFIRRNTRTPGEDIFLNHKNNPNLGRLLDDMIEMSDSTGSGAGAPMLAHRTIAWQIKLGTCIGKGRFGEVFIGDWKGEKVAVKIFISRDEKSWSRETEVYQTNMLRHSNLLRWIASDNKDTGTLTQLWLVTEYHPLGSLYDYLEKNTLSTTVSIQLLRSIAHGLSYLHAEVPGVNNQCMKPAIAHRDLKTKNILIKNDMTCAIADLGLAVRYMNGEIDIPENSRGGTVRYLAPEFLDESMVTNRFNSYVNLDIYALALVFWEVARRMEYSLVAWGALPYEPPYFEYIPRDPTIEEMLQCVVVDKNRPTIPEDWQNSGPMMELTRIMQECWATNPNSRHTALNIRYSLDKLAAAERLKITI